MMFKSLFLLAILGLGADAYALRIRESERPITKVINMLKEMTKQLVAEGEEDQRIFDQLDCWCKTQDKEKTEAIAENESTIKEKTALIAELSGKVAKHTSEIEHLEKDLQEETNSLAQAQELRDKQLAEFNGSEKDMLQSIQALQAAITILSKNHTPQVLLQAQSEIKTVLTLRKNYVAPDTLQALQAFIQQPANFKSYQSQSGAIFGILNQMLDSFNANLSSAQKDELENSKNFEELKAAKTNEIEKLSVSLRDHKKNLAAASEDRVNAKTELKDTRASLSENEKFMIDMKEKCQSTDQEFEARKKTREEEIGAVNAALEVLTAEGNDAVFAGSNKAEVEASTGFLQLKTTDKQKAIAILQKISKENPRFSALAVSARLDGFERVKKAIDDMVAALLQEKDEEIKKRDYCIKSKHDNKEKKNELDHTKNNLKTEIDGLDQDIEGLKATVEDLTAKIEADQDALKKAAATRQEENTAFRKVVADQRETVRLLNSALGKLKSFYGFTQIKTSQPAPAGFKTYEKNSSAGGVIGLIETIIRDTEAYELETVKDEKDAQQDYEKMQTETTNVIKQNTKHRSDTKGEIAQKRTARADNKQDLSQTLDELEAHMEFSAEVDKDCKFTMDNFDTRQARRDDEVNALREAKDYLSGQMKSGIKGFNFLQVIERHF